MKEYKGYQIPNCTLEELKLLHFDGSNCSASSGKICPRPLKDSCDGCLAGQKSLKQDYIQQEEGVINLKSKENNMNTNISNVFDKTKEALLVEKHLGNQISTSFIDGLILADKKEDVLKEAKRLEKEEKDK